MKSPSPVDLRPLNGGFSLVEIVLAIGITSFALIATLGLLPVGLNTLRESSTQTAVANISQYIRGELQQISFNPATSFNVQNLNSTTYYFTRDGVKTDANGGYYLAKFDLTNGSVGGNTFDSTSAQNIKVTLSYPATASAAARKTFVFSLFAARQSNQ